MAITAFPRRPVYAPPEGAALNLGHPLARGLQALWLFGEGGGITTVDSVTRGKANLLGVLKPTWVGGPVGPGLKFDGVTGYVQDAYDSRLNCPSAITLVGWGLVGTSNNAVMFGKPAAVTYVSPWFDYLLYNNAGAFLVRVDTTIDQVTGITTSKDTQLAFTADGVNWKMFIDGQVRKSAANSVLPANTISAGVLFGADQAAGQLWNGTIRQAMIYNRALAPAEIAWLYADPLAMMAPTLPLQRVTPIAAAATTTGNLALLGVGN